LRPGRRVRAEDRRPSGRQPRDGHGFDRVGRPQDRHRCAAFAGQDAVAAGTGDLLELAAHDVLVNASGAHRVSGEHDRLREGEDERDDGHARGAGTCDELRPVARRRVRGIDDREQSGREAPFEVAMEDPERDVGDRLVGLVS
jgi:hypothetical protein